MSASHLLNKTTTQSLKLNEGFVFVWVGVKHELPVLIIKRGKVYIERVKLLPALHKLTLPWANSERLWAWSPCYHVIQNFNGCARAD
jgi:hypothetical protein